VGLQPSRQQQSTCTQRQTRRKDGKKRAEGKEEKQRRGRKQRGASKPGTSNATPGRGPKGNAGLPGGAPAVLRAAHGRKPPAHGCNHPPVHPPVRPPQGCLTSASLGRPGSVTLCYTCQGPCWLGSSAVPMRVPVCDACRPAMQHHAHHRVSLPIKQRHSSCNYSLTHGSQELDNPRRRSTLPTEGSQLLAFRTCCAVQLN
jgi:hypothetical protein